MLDKIFKTIVGKRAGALVPTTSNSDAMKNMVSMVQGAAHALLIDKEWVCPCGHKFRASGEWVATVPTMCEVPNCPNPKYYLDGPGRALLEANPQGVKLTESNGSSTQVAAGEQPKGLPSRFRK